MFIIIVALFVSFVVGYLRVSRILDTYVFSKPSVISRLYGCDFCLCFWVSVLVSICLFAITFDYTLLFLPFFTTQLSKLLV